MMQHIGINNVNSFLDRRRNVLESIRKQEVKSRMAKEKILIIEDDPDILELVQYNLEREGYQVYTSKDGELGLRLSEEILPDMILLDIMLPGLDGIKVCKKLRDENKTHKIPIMMLTAKSEESDIIVGLEMGADDYITKPFSPKELIARIRAILRRTKEDPTPQLQGVHSVGPVTIDPERHEVYLRGKILTLTLAEYKLIATLISRPGRVFTREQLLDQVSGSDTVVIDRNVDVHVRSIRKKFGSDADFIVTVRGVGYKCLG